mgnify:CR=1 FL=1
MATNFTGDFNVDFIGAQKDDRTKAEKFVRNLDFKEVCQNLIIKKIQKIFHYIIFFLIIRIN